MLNPCSSLDFAGSYLSVAKTQETFPWTTKKLLLQTRSPKNRIKLAKRKRRSGKVRGGRRRKGWSRRKGSLLWERRKREEEVSEVKDERNGREERIRL